MIFGQGSFINDASATPSEMERKREAIRSMLGQYGKARYVGEGVADLLTGIAGGIGSARLDKQEAAAREQATQQYKDILGGWNPFGGGAISTSGPRTHGADGAFGDAYGAGTSGPANNATRNAAMAATGGPTQQAADQLRGRDREILAKTLMAEAGGEGLQGMIAAGAVINNRLNAGGYGDSLEGVIMKPGQFSAWNGVTGYAGGQGGLDMANMTPSEQAYQAADALLSGQYQDPTGGATHYYNPAAANPAWGAQGGGEWTRIGNHVFGSADAGRGPGPGTISTQSSTPSMPSYTGPSVQDLAQLMANPWLTPEQRSAVGVMMQQAQQASDPMRQLQWQQAQQDLALGQARLEQARNPQTVRTLSSEEAAQLGLPVGGVYQQARDGSISTAATAPKATNVGDQYRVVGNTLYDLGAEGGPKPVGEGQGQEMVVYGPSGEPIMVQGPSGSSTKFTEGQSKDNVYSTRARGALEVLDPLAETLTSRVDRGAEMVPFGLGRGVQSDDFQVAQQAGTEFLQAILRKDTGAAITTDETESYGRVYLPQPGDGPAVLEAKRQARIRAVNAIESGMNPSQMLARDRALLKSEIEAGTYEPQPGNPAPTQEQPKRLRYNPETGELE